MILYCTLELKSVVWCDRIVLNIIAVYTLRRRKPPKCPGKGHDTYEKMDEYKPNATAFVAGAEHGHGAFPTAHGGAGGGS